MNLLAKRTGLFFLFAVLLLISCEDDSFLLGFKGKTKFKGRYYEFVPQSSVVIIDSLITDNHNSPSVTSLLAGQYFDTRFGTVRAEAFTQFLPSFSDNIEEGVYDSITIELRLDLYTYGSTLDSEEKFTIHEITEDSLSFFSQYYQNSSLVYNTTPLGEVTYKLVYDTLQKYKSLGTNTAASLTATARLNQSFGETLFDFASVDSAFIKIKDFRFAYKGLAIVPSTSNKYILGFGGSTSSATTSRITLHYHTAEEDSLALDLYFNSNYTVGFSNITVNRMGDLAAVPQSYKSYTPPTLRYLQSGSPVMTLLDISEYYDFIRGDNGDGKDSLEKILINSAEISIDAIETPPDGMPAPNTLRVYVFNVNEGSGDAKFMNRAVYTDSASMAGSYLYEDSKYYSPGGDLLGGINPLRPSNFVSLSYNSDKKKYVGYMTLFLQDLFDQKNAGTDITSLAILPVSPVPGKSVHRAVFDASSIKIKVRYTTPVSSNLD
jgi:hypothetical protein